MLKEIQCIYSRYVELIKRKERERGLCVVGEE